MAPAGGNCLTVLAVTHNSAADVERLARSWRSLEPCPHPGWSAPALVVADCGSTDATAAAVGRWLPEAAWLALSNIGYGAAANRGARAAAAEWLLLCNPDLEFTPSFLRTIQQAVAPTDSPCPAVPAEAAIVAPQLRNTDGTVQASVGRFPTLLSLAADQCRPRPWRKYLQPQPAVAGPVDWATGACLLLRSAAFWSVGGFDPLYFMYMEEVDLQYRLRQAGRVTWFLPQAQVVHRAPLAQRRPHPLPQRWAARGALRFFAKHGRPGQLPGYRLMAWAGGRLPWAEAFARRSRILETATGPG